MRETTRNNEGGKYKIEKNLFVCTTKKKENKVVFIDGCYWLRPEENYNPKHLSRYLRSLVVRFLPKAIIIFDFPKSIDTSHRFFFSYKIFFLTKTSESFNDYCEKIKPVILKIKPRFLEIIRQSGFLPYLTKKSD